MLALLPKQDLDKDNQQLTMQTSAIEATVHVDGHVSCSQVDLLIAGTFFSSSVSLSVYLRLFMRSHNFSALMTFVLSTAISFSARAHYVCMQSTVSLQDVTVCMQHSICSSGYSTITYRVITKFTVHMMNLIC